MSESPTTAVNQGIEYIKSRSNGVKYTVWVFNSDVKIIDTNSFPLIASGSANFTKLFTVMAEQLADQDKDTAFIFMTYGAYTVSTLNEVDDVLNMCKAIVNRFPHEVIIK